MNNDTSMVIDCRTCPVREVRCDDCIVTALRGQPLVRLDDGELPLDPAERRAVDIFVGAGMLDPDRAVMLTARREPWSGVRAVG
jgi:hypothetical protein